MYENFPRFEQKSICVFQFAGISRCELTIWPYLLVCWKVWKWVLCWNSLLKMICKDISLDTPGSSCKAGKIYKLQMFFESPCLLSQFDTFFVHTQCYQIIFHYFTVVAKYFCVLCKSICNEIENILITVSVDWWLMQQNHNILLTNDNSYYISLLWWISVTFGQVWPCHVSPLTYSR